MNELDIIIEKEQMSVIEINIDEIKKNLAEFLALYKNLVVTEENLSLCKDDQKKLAGLRAKVDRYRIDKKKEHLKAIEGFESQCKEIVEMIFAVEDPIKTGIAVYDNIKREEKKAIAKELITEVIHEVGLNEKYAPNLTVLDQYCNLGASKKGVREDLIHRAFALKTEQDAEAERLEIFQDVIDTENLNLNSKLSIQNFTRLIGSGASTKDIIAEIKSKAQLVYNAENVAVADEKQPSTAPYVTEASAPCPNPPAKDETMYFAVYKISGSLEQLRSVSAFLKTNGIAYHVTDQGMVV